MGVYRELEPWAELLEMLVTRNAAMGAGRSELGPELVAKFERRHDGVIGRAGGRTRGDRANSR